VKIEKSYHSTVVPIRLASTTSVSVRREGTAAAAASTSGFSPRLLAGACNVCKDRRRRGQLQPTL
jgi:hypothetical protein